MILKQNKTKQLPRKFLEYSQAIGDTALYNNSYKFGIKFFFQNLMQTIRSTPEKCIYVYTQTNTVLKKYVCTHMSMQALSQMSYS